MIKHNFYDNDYHFSFDPDEIINLILDATCEILNINDEHIVSYILMNNEQIHAINKQYRNIDRETDVISFAEIDWNDGILGYELGDIYISVDRVASQAKDYRHSEKREFAFLVTHGILHLLGYDHMKKEDEMIMFPLQDKILEKVDIKR